MRIAMLSWESLHSVAVGGVGAHVSELAGALARKDQEVHVFTRMAPGQRYHDFIEGVHYHRCPYPPHDDFVDDVNNMCRSFVDRLFAVEDIIGAFDIVHAHEWLAANAMIWIKQGRGHKSVLTVHATEYARCGNCYSSGRSQRVRDQEQAGTYWADRVICVSHATKQETISMYQVPDWKTSVIYNGVNPRRFDAHIDLGRTKQQYDIGPLDPTVFFCGRLTWQKGPDILLEAVGPVLNLHSGAKFIFAGDGDMRGWLESRAAQLGVAHAVRFLGYRNGNELPALFQLPDVVCVPSRNEPFGIVVLEAWAAGKPVVVTQNGGPNEYVTHEVDGLKIYPRPDSVIWGLATAFADFDRARRMGLNGRRKVEQRFTWDMIADQTLDIYKLACPDANPAAGQDSAAAETGSARNEITALAGSALVQHTSADTRRQHAVPIQLRARLTAPKTHSVEAVSRWLDACKQSLARSGLGLKRQGRTLVTSGGWDTVMPALHRCCRLAERMNLTPLKASVRFQNATAGSEQEPVGSRQEPVDSRQ